MFKIIIITNQSGIGRGYYSDTTFQIFMRQMQKTLNKYGATIDEYYYCSCDPTKFRCANRKPEPTLFLKAAVENNIDLQASFMVGDKASDVLAAHQAGLRNIYLFDRSKSFKSDIKLNFDYEIIENLCQISD